LSMSRPIGVWTRYSITVSDLTNHSAKPNMAFEALESAP
jgi:hypothetical protein